MPRSRSPPRWSGASGSARERAVWAGVVLIGGCGSVLRFLVDGAVSAGLGRPSPTAPWSSTSSGALVLGFLTGLALAPEEALLAGTAAVGSYTTFSTWMFETQRLTEERQVRYLAANQCRRQPASGRRRSPPLGQLDAERTCERRLSQADRATSASGNGSDGRFVADALLDLFGRHGVASQHSACAASRASDSNTTCAPTAR